MLFHIDDAMRQMRRIEKDHWAYKSVDLNAYTCAPGRVFTVYPVAQNQLTCSFACFRRTAATAVVLMECVNGCSSTAHWSGSEQTQSANGIQNGTPSPATLNTSSVRTNVHHDSEHASEHDTSPEGSAETHQHCVVCGDEQAKMHYGVMACFGCKGFFRRALKRADQYECQNGNNCVIDKLARNSCRSCRLSKCLAAGMDPSAVRPDRDFTGKQQSSRPANRRQRSSPSASTKADRITLGNDDWIRRLPVEMRTMLMTLLNIEAKISKGDTTKDASTIYPLHVNNLREIMEDPVKLKGKRTEMRYEPYRMAKNQELSVIAYRRLIAAIDWVEFLSEMMNGITIEDRISLVKNSFAPLMVFKCSAKTAAVTDNNDVLCLCNFAYVPRDISKAYSDTYHLGNGLVDRALNELVGPFRRIRLKDEEVVCISAIIVLNPHSKDLSEKGMTKVADLRDRVLETLFQIIKESRPCERASTQYGNILLSLPTVTILANSMCENLRFAQTFSSLGGIPLLTSLFGCFPVEPFSDLEVEKEKICKDSETQTDPSHIDPPRGQKRRLPSQFTSPVENDPEGQNFRLLRPPCSYTLTEMFDDRQNNFQFVPPSQPSTSAMAWPIRQTQSYPIMNSNNYYFDQSSNLQDFSANMHSRS
uniref:Nuclear receptor domain-containing protein n=1 Tax=Steinernema glaseri TaxID=37863 RepID=A0A1I7ZKT6_9BILA